MTCKRMPADDFAGTRLLKPFRRTLMGLKFGHKNVLIILQAPVGRERSSENSMAGALPWSQKLRICLGKAGFPRGRLLVPYLGAAGAAG
jgi:hypothetical protein